jgi:urease accessory protein
MYAEWRSEVMPPAAPKMQRAAGAARIAFRRAGKATRLERLYQDGAAKIRLPLHAAGPAEAILINTAGGLTGGDALDFGIALRTGARAVVTTQACERIYRSAGGEARIATRADIGPGARLDWLPQETILFDGGRLKRSLDVDIGAGGELLVLEALIFGRAAMGETIRSGAFHDRWRIRREGRLAFADDLRIEGDIAGQLARPGILGGHGALATLLYVGPDGESLLDPLRDVVGEAGGASAWDGKLLARLTAPDGFALRCVLAPALTILMAGRPLPKAWVL